MTYQERIKIWPLYSSQRGWFAFELYKQMAADKKIWLLVGDLGYKVFDAHFEDFPERTINCSAAEQAMMGTAVGLALEGKIPFVYSITTFLLYRPFETIRNYINHENIPVKLIASGRDKDYKHDGFSHWSEDAEEIIDAAFPNIYTYWPKEKEEIPKLVDELITNNSPSFLSLRR